jgi:hypothetical protein
MSSVSPKLKTFTEFSKLPPEIRLRVWHFASPPPRIVELSYGSEARSVISRTHPPALLHTSHESRAATIKSYKELQFGDCSQRIPIDFQKDTLFFGSGCKCMVPSGKSNPWIIQNKKVLKDILGSISLAQNLYTAVFDCSFLLALDREDPVTSATGLVKSMENLSEVLLVRTVVDDLPNKSVLHGVGRKLKPVKKMDNMQMRCFNLLMHLPIDLDAFELIPTSNDIETQ